MFADRVAVTHAGASWTYADFAERVERLAGALHERGVRPGDRVAAVAENVPGLLELHYAAAGSGAVIVPVNFRLGPTELGLIFADSEPSLVFADAPYRDALPRTAEILPVSGSEHEQLLASAAPRAIAAPDDEMTLLSVNYTSGTTGKPKGVMYTHRGAYLHSLGVVGEARLGNSVALPVDAADVPLPRLGVHLGGDGGGRAARVPAPPRPAGGLGADRSRGDLAPVRRPDGADRAAGPPSSRTSGRSRSSRAAPRRRPRCSSAARRSAGT